MVGEQTEQVNLLIFGTFGMLILAMAFILFFFLYQKKIAQQMMVNKQLELQQQRALLLASIQSKEKEQRRIAQELHDDVGSSLSALKLNLPTLSLNKEDKKLVNTQLNDLVLKVRKISNELLPSVLDELGLINALNNLSTTLNKSVTTQINFIDNTEDQFDLTQETELALYRITQEILNNILKYANAEHIEIELSSKGKILLLEYKDDGDGFDPTKSTKVKAESHGLKNIKGRIQQINADINYQLTNPGTKVSISIEL